MFRYILIIVGKRKGMIICQENIRDPPLSFSLRRS
jgi:hypothetical protein